MPRLFSASVVLLLATLAPQTRAQVVAPRPADPVAQPSRFDERWAAAPSGSALWRQLKHLPLAANDRAWITLGGSLRLRGIETLGFQFSDADVMRDGYSEWRLLASADAWVGRRAGWHARAFAEWRDAQGFGRTLPGGVRSSEADRSDWQDLFADVGHAQNGLRVGRQDVALGRERFVGIADWTNSRRSFDGTRLFAGRGRYTIDAFDGRVVQVRTNAPNRADGTSHLRFGQLSYAAAPAVSQSPAGRSRWAIAGWEAYVFDAESQSGATRRVTTGGRSWAVRRAATTDWTVEAEAAVQRGESGARDLRAWFAVGEGSVTWRSRKWSPSINVGVDAASGTSAADSATRAGTFAPPYATAHSTNGIADVFGRGNLLERRLGLGARPNAQVQLALTARRFARVRTDDGVYSKQNTLLRGAGGSDSRWIADEVDLTAQWTPRPQLRLLGGGAWVGAGDFIRETGTAAPVRWAFASVTVLF